MSTEYTQVSVANADTDEPLPGIVIDTELGDVIIIIDNYTRQIGIHGPDEMTMDQLQDVVESAGEDESQPFKQEVEAPLIFEGKFMWADLA